MIPLSGDIPPYVYNDNETSPQSLSQGDVLKINSELDSLFNEHYPTISGKADYVLVLTQTCDLVREQKRKPKLPHINVCLVKSLQEVFDRIIKNDVQPETIGKYRLLTRAEMDQLKDALSKLLNNNSQKSHFFLA